MAWRRFLARLMRGTGQGALCAGLLCFVAANWQVYGVLGRFVLLQSALFIAVGVAIWRPPPQAVGQAALLLATLLTGGLLALFGQVYQTGADVHELFFAWSLLALPFALAGSFAPLWAFWWCVLNVALALLCGWMGAAHAFWRSLDVLGLGSAALLMLPCLINLAGAALFGAMANRRSTAAAPVWLARMLTTFGMLYGTAACVTVQLGQGRWRLLERTDFGEGTLVTLAFVLISAIMGVATWRRRRDVFNMALIATSWIAISTAWLAGREFGGFFTIAWWLAVCSTGAGLLLMHWVRQWRDSKAQEPRP